MIKPLATPQNVVLRLTSDPVLNIMIGIEQQLGYVTILYKRTSLSILHVKTRRVYMYQCVCMYKLTEYICINVCACKNSPSIIQASKYLKIGTCPALQKLLAYMGKF